LKHVYSNLTEEWPGRTAPVQTSEQANNASLIEDSVDGEDPLWEPLLEPVIGYAESLPYAISHWIRHHADSRL
jgi:hypothetical protein